MSYRVQVFLTTLKRVQARPYGKYPIFSQDGSPVTFAGMWGGERAPDGEVLRILPLLTTAAHATMRQWHERMPVILEPDDGPIWLGEVEGDVLHLRTRWAMFFAGDPIQCHGCPSEECRRSWK